MATANQRHYVKRRTSGLSAECATYKHAECDDCTCSCHGDRRRLETCRAALVQATRELLEKESENQRLRAIFDQQQRQQEVPD